MTPSSRQSHILTLLEIDEILSISRLQKLLAVSHMTVRRDIKALEKSGHVRSVRGGVVTANGHLHHDHNTVTTQQSVTSQLDTEWVLQTLHKQLHAHQVIYLHHGHISLEIAKQLPADQGLTVVTNDIAITNTLHARAFSEVYFIGGFIDRSKNASVGSRAEKALKNFNIDLAFVSNTTYEDGSDTLITSVKTSAKRCCSVPETN